MHFANISFHQEVLFRNPLNPLEIRLGNVPIVQTYSQKMPKYSHLVSSSRWGRLLKYDVFCSEEGRLKVQKKKILKLKKMILRLLRIIHLTKDFSVYLPPKENLINKVVTELQPQPFHPLALHKRQTGMSL